MLVMATFGLSEWLFHISNERNVLEQYGMVHDALLKAAHFCVVLWKQLWNEPVT